MADFSVYLFVNNQFPINFAETELTVQVISTKTDVPYDAALSDSNNYAFILMNTTMCTQVSTPAIVFNSWS